MAVAEDPFERRYGLGGGDAGTARVKILEQHPVLSHFLDRRTLRQYTGQPVDPQLIDTLLDVAFAAPSKSDYQPASVIRVDAPDKRREIAALVPAMPWVG